MSKFDLAAANEATLEISAYPSPAVDAFAQPTFAGVAAPPAVRPFDPAVALDEPSSLTLALIGVVSLACYRAIVHHVTKRSVAKPAPRQLVKPRRRAA
jgi:hypothetical protein